MWNQTELDRVMGGQLRSELIDRLIAELAERQHGVVARRQLRENGMGSDAIDHRVKVGRLHVGYRGVYAVGHRILTTHGSWKAAVLGSGSGCGAALSHRAVAALWKLRPRSHLEVTVPSWRRARPGIVIHHAELPTDEVTTEDGIPLTMVPRTLLDLAAVLPRNQLERAVNEAEVRPPAEDVIAADLRKLLRSGKKTA
jgi:hypothetical protein